MRIGILILIAFLLSIASLIYLAMHYKEAEQVFKVQYILQQKKLLIYSVIGMGIMSGLAVALECVYKQNTLLHNIKLVVLAAILLTVTITDLKEQIIPNKVILTGIVIRVVVAGFEVFTMGSKYFATMKGDLVALAIVVILFVVGNLIIKNGIGMGDIKLIMVMSIFQGFSGIISSLFLSLIVSFIIAVFMLITKKKTRKDTIEFAPAVLLGTLISMFLTGM